MPWKLRLLGLLELLAFCSGTVGGPQIENRLLLSESRPPALSDDDVVEVYHILSEFVVNDTSQFGVPFIGSSSGIAFRSTRTTTVVAFEFAPEEYSQCLLPQTDNTAIRWSCAGVVSYSMQIDPKYWKSSGYLTHTSGLVYNRFVNWAGGYTEKFPRYIPMAVCNQDQVQALLKAASTMSSKDLDKCYKQSNAHNDFTSKGFDNLAAMGVQLHPLIPPKQTKVILLVPNEPKSVWYNDLAHQQDILQFYINLVQCTRTSLSNLAVEPVVLSDVVHSLGTCYGATKYGYSPLEDQEYYQLQVLAPGVQDIVIPHVIPQAQQKKDPGGDAVDWLLAIIIFGVFFGGLYYTWRRLAGKPCLDPLDEDGDDDDFHVRRKRRRVYEWLPRWLLDALSRNDSQHHDSLHNSNGSGSGPYYEMMACSAPNKPSVQREESSSYTSLPLVEEQASQARADRAHSLDEFV